MLLDRDTEPGWQKALERAHDPKAHKYPLQIKHISGDLLTSDRISFKATSGQTGRWDYGIYLDFGPLGPDITCGCQAQKHGLACDHSSLALEMAGLLSLDAELAIA